MNIGFSLNDMVDAGVGQTPPHLVMLTLRFIVQITTIRNTYKVYITLSRQTIFHPSEKCLHDLIDYINTCLLIYLHRMYMQVLSG